MDAAATSHAGAGPAASPEPGFEPLPVVRSSRAADAADQRLAAVIARQPGTESGPVPPPPPPPPDPSTGDAAVPIATRPAPGARATGVEAPAEPLRAWDAERPRHDDIAAWRWHDGDWRWQDARGRQAAPAEWSKPTVRGTFDGFRVPLDSALALRLYQHDPAVADTIAPGVMAHAAAALSAGRLASTGRVEDLIPLMQRMTVDRQLEIDRGLSALAEGGAPEAVGPYARLRPETATYFNDGTWNHKDAAGDHGGTNIAAMNTLMLVAHQMDRRIPEPQYFAGVGNEKDNDPLMQKIGGATGAGMGTILSNIENAFRADRESGISDFAAFGFSRGAAETMEASHRFEDIAQADHQPIHLRFIGLFDTVAAVGPTGRGTGDLRLQPPRGIGQPDRLYHAISQDESRDLFHLVDVGTGGVDHIIKDSFAGAHSDVGGGYLNKGLSNIALHRMVEEARRAGVPMPTVEAAIVAFPEHLGDLVPFLHQDHNAERHYESGWYSSDDVRTLPADVKPSEFLQKRIDKRTETALVRNQNHEFDRRSDAFLEKSSITIVHVDPDGRFVHTQNDRLVPEQKSLPSRSSQRREPDADSGIPIRTHDDQGTIVVDEGPAAGSGSARDIRLRR